MYVERLMGRLLEDEHFSEATPKMAFVVGPRQCGKTTLARSLQAGRGTPDLYRNWDDLNWRRDLSARPYGFIDAFRPKTRRRPMAVLDEIHKFPRWKIYLKGLWDTRAEMVDILVTGSGRLDVYRRGGDSLLGRYHQYRLHPFSLSEVLQRRFVPDRDTPEKILARLIKESQPPAAKERQAFEVLERFGGFPEPFVKQSVRRHRMWIRERKERLIREDLREMSRIQMLSSIEQMVELLTPRVGSLLSLNNLRQDLGVSMWAVRLWMDQLERLFYGFRIRPYAGKLARALSREPKFYLYDWSELPDESKRLENLVACALLGWCHFTQDFGQESLDLRFVRDKEKREVDFLLVKEGKPFLLIEVKTSDRTLPPALPYFSEKLGHVQRLLLVRNLDRPGLSGRTTVLPVVTFLSAIP